MKHSLFHRFLAAALALLLLISAAPVQIYALEASDWEALEAPVLTGAQVTDSGTIQVSATGLVGRKGAAELVICMYDSQGNLIRERQSVLPRSEHSMEFVPEFSDTYTFKAWLRRDGFQEKPAAQELQVAFVLPLESPVLMSATSKGNGTMELVWAGVKEAAAYEILCDGAAVGTTQETTFLVEGLTVGQGYRFQVAATRGDDRKVSQELTATATQDAKTAWGHTYYGPSTNSANNGYVGDLNEDGQVTVYSEGGKGKVVPGSCDGISFYYTAIPADYNFTLRAKVYVDSWKLSNGQEGFGLLAADRLGASGDSGNLWNNQYMVGTSKIEYMYDAADEVALPLDSGIGTKYTMKLGLGIISKTGVTKENLPLFNENDSTTIQQSFLSEIYSLETGAGYLEQEKGTYNIIGNYQEDVPGTLQSVMITEMILEIQRNPSGYFITYYAADGQTILSQKKFYDRDALCKLDENFIYVGFFAARNARATFSDVTLTTVKASEDDRPVEEKPITYIEPTISMSSATVTTKQAYTLTLDTNVNGKATISLAGKVIAEDVPIMGLVRYSLPLSLIYGNNRVQVTFIPDRDQDLGPDTSLTDTEKVFVDETVVCNKGFYHRKLIYVSPKGQPNGTGDKEYPLDIYTAVNNVVPGQTIVLLEGTYNLISTVRIQRGMSGTAEEPIRMIADPAAATRPVLDFQGSCPGIVHGGDYWYFAGFDVTNSQIREKGFQVSGSHNVLDQIHAYRNGNTGIQLSRLTGSDMTIDSWPSYNLILNCTSYLNADPGEEDADGFAAKLTCGVGNVFEGCVAYLNADDGWDLYAKVETGPIGAVTIRNCVAYKNGIREDGSLSKGNGNGFKMGGDSLSGYHVLENSYSFYNKAKGLDSNSCPDIIIRNCVSYNNGSYNVAFYTNNAGNTDFEGSGILSFRDATSPFPDATMADNLKPKGDQDEDKFLNDSCYYWRGTEANNGAGVSLTADMFQSLNFSGSIARKADGSIDMQGFLVRTEKTPANAGVHEEATPSQDMVTIPENPQHDYGQEWYILDNQFHWRECECGDRGHYGPHELVWIVDKEATPTVTGKRHQECTTCGHKKPAVDVYYESPVIPTQPTQPSGSAGTEPSSMSPVIIIVIVVAVVVIGGAAVLVILKKKK